MTQIFGRYIGALLPSPGEVIELDPYDGFFDLEELHLPSAFLLAWEAGSDVRVPRGTASILSPEQAAAVLELPMVRCVRDTPTPDSMTVRVASVVSLREEICASTSVLENADAVLAAEAPDQLRSTWGRWVRPVFLPTSETIARARELETGAGLRIQTGEFPQTESFVVVIRETHGIVVVGFGSFDPESSSWYTIPDAHLDTAELERRGREDLAH